MAMQLSDAPAAEPCSFCTEAGHGALATAAVNGSPPIGGVAIESALLSP